MPGRAAIGVMALVMGLGLAGCSSSGPDRVRASRSPDSTESVGSSSAGATVVPPDAGGGTDGFASVPIGGGGFVTGISISDDGSTRVVRTDVGGSYRWDAAAADGAGSWVLDTSATTMPASDVGPDLAGGALAVAVAPSDGRRVYLAYNDALYRSDDAAQSWTKVLDGVSTAANDDFRTTGSRLAVDPGDPDVVYYGTQLQGLYLTRDGGASWTTVPTGDSGVPMGLTIDVEDPATRGDILRPTLKSPGTSSGASVAGAGVNAIAIDSSGGRTGSQIVYAASFGSGIYRSSDSGNTWSRISPSQIESVGYMRVEPDGDVIVTSHSDPTDQTSDSDVWRLHDGDWSLITPRQGANWKGIAVDPMTPGRIALMAPGGQTALSGDDGATWSLVGRVTDSDGDVPWLSWAQTGDTHFLGFGEITFDPAVRGRLWFAEGTGVWYTDLGANADPSSVGVAASDVPDRVGPGARVITWHSQTRGIEELAPNGVISPPGGEPVFNAWDRALFRSDLKTYPASYGPTNGFTSAWSTDWSVSDPAYLVADIASQHAPFDPSQSGYSTNGGQTWKPFPSIPMDSTNGVKTFGFGAIAVGAPGNVVWAPAYGRQPYVTRDGGESWKPVVLPGVTDYSSVYPHAYYTDHQVLASDKAAPGTFYLYVVHTGTFRSTDGGDSWTQMSDDDAMRGSNFGYQVSLKAVPGRDGELFITNGQVPDATDEPLLHSIDGGASWTPISDVTGVTAFGFGAPMGGSADPAMFIAGYVRGDYGIFRSTDDAQSWTKLTTYPTGRTNPVLAMDGDKNAPGQVFLALGGSSWVYGK